jgi:hypothetical protein
MRSRLALLVVALFGIVAASASASGSVGFYGCRAFTAKHPVTLAVVGHEPRQRGERHALSAEDVQGSSCLHCARLRRAAPGTRSRLDDLRLLERRE